MPLSIVTAHPSAFSKEQGPTVPSGETGHPTATFAPRRGRWWSSRVLLRPSSDRSVYSHSRTWRQQCVHRVAIAVRQVQGFISKLKSAYLVLFAKFLENLGFLTVHNANLCIEFGEHSYPLGKHEWFRLSEPVRNSQYGVSYPLHIVRCTNWTWMSLRFTVLHRSFLTPLWYPQ